jgi:hypothetical protein
MAGLSISSAWEETKAVLNREGRLLAPVALGLVAIPVAVANFFAPVVGNEAMTPGGWIVILIASLIVFAIGYLALTRLSIFHQEQVGAAIGHSVRRLLPFIVSALLITFALILCASLVAAASAPNGNQLEELAVGALLLLLLVLSPLFGRLMLIGPVSVCERGGPVHLLRRSWSLTSGYTFVLMGTFLLSLIALIILEIAVGFGSLMLAALLFGPVSPLSASKLVVALIAGLLRSVEFTVIAAMLARIYLQLAGRDSIAIGVPRSGT